MTNTLTKQQPKLSVRKPGHWRNKWFAPVAIVFNDGDCGPTGEYVGWLAFASESEARRDAMRWQAEATTKAAKACIYLGPVFFPEEGDGQ